MADIFTIIAPVFLIMMLGYGLGKTRLFPEGSAGILITFVWYVAIPALLVGSLAPKALPHASEMLLVLGYYGALYAVYALAMLLTRTLFGLSAGEQATFAFVTCFGNAVFIGIPIIESVFGAKGVVLLLMLVSFHSLTLLPVTTILVERTQKGGAAGNSIVAETFKSVRQNPIIIALVVGLSWSAFSLPFPYWLDRVLALPAAAAAPVGLFAVGLSLSTVKIAGNITHAMLAVGLKLLVLPLAVFAATHYILALPAEWVGIATIMAALPSGMIPYSFATQYGVGPRRAATAVLISTGLSAITLSAVLLILKTGALS